MLTIPRKIAEILQFFRNFPKSEVHGIGVTIGLGSTAEVVGTLTRSSGVDDRLSVEKGGDFIPHIFPRFS